MDSVFFYVAKFAWLLVAVDSVLVMWLSLGVLCLYMGWLKAARRLLLTLVVVCLTIALFPLGEWLFYPLEKQNFPASLPAKIDGIVVLGGGEAVGLSHAWQQVALGEGGERLTAMVMLANT